MMSRTHTMRVRFGIPALVLRGVIVLVGGLTTVVLSEYPIWQIVGVLAFLLGAILPQTLATWAGAACIVASIAMSDPSAWRTAIALLVIHFVHVLGCVCLTIPALSRVHPRVLLPTLRRFLLVEVIAQPIALLVILLPTVDGGGVAWLAPAGAVIVLALAVLYRRVDRHS